MGIGCVVTTIGIWPLVTNAEICADSHDVCSVPDPVCACQHSVRVSSTSSLCRNVITRIHIAVFTKQHGLHLTCKTLRAQAMPGPCLWVHTST